MGKNKLARWTELGSFENVIQPSIREISGKDHPVKGRWHEEIFRNNNPIVLELGCGKGEYSVELASRFPGKNYIGIDIKGARMWRGAKSAHEEKLTNIAFLRTRIEFITAFFAENEVDEIWITFPDPHQGGRNSNKRLTSPWFLNSYRQFLKNKGIIHLKTDNKELFNYTLKVAGYNKMEIVGVTPDLYSECTSDDLLSIKTHYEKLFLAKGMPINYVSFKLEKETNIEDATQGANRER